MRIFLLFLFVLIINACKNKTNKGEPFDITKQSSALLKADTTINDGITFILNYDTSQVLRIFSSERDLILESKEEAVVHHMIGFQDFNHDGFEDVYLSYYTNVPGATTVLLYDPNAQNFKYIDGIQHFFNPVHIENTAYYYAYNRAGCADYNWESFLFAIQGYSAFELAYMNGIGCDDEEKGIFIYDNSDYKNQVLLEELPIVEPQEKFDFIHDYWKSHWKKYVY